MTYLPLQAYFETIPARSTNFHHMLSFKSRSNMGSEEKAMRVPDFKEESNNYVEEDGAAHEEQWYMYSMSEEVENIERYRPGGYHPVNLGDRLGGQYKIIHKLGHGGFGTVWLARDIREEKYVAIKIVMSKHSKATVKHELKILKYIAEHVGRPGGNFIDIPIEDFWINGPNGHHLCIVSEVAGPSIAQLTRNNKKVKTEDAQRMALQITQCLGFLHYQKIGVAHGDLTSGNVLLELNNFGSLPVEKVHELLGQPSREQVRPFTGRTLGNSAPEFVYQAADLTKLSQFYSGNIILIDFGDAFFLDDVPGGVGTPAQFCSPELLIQSLCGKSSDVWALACTIFEIRCGRVLFEAFMGSDEDVLLAMLGALGPFPSHFTKGEEFEWLKDAEGDGSELEEVVFNIKSISEDEACALYDLLKSTLRYDIEDRLTADEILRHPWFSYNFQVGGGAEAE
jgi:serine/threonine protein kinase